MKKYNFFSKNIFEVWGPLISNLMLKIFLLETILGTNTGKNEILVILERFLQAKTFEKRLNIFAKNDQRINIDKNIALDESVKKHDFAMYPPLWQKWSLVSY
jgi:hypothetical protein